MVDRISIPLEHDDITVSDTVVHGDGTIEARARGRLSAACCPDCGAPSMRTCGGRTRRVSERAHTLVVWLVLYVRRFASDAGDCSGVTFREPLVGVGRSKFTDRLWAWVGDLGRGQSEQAIAAAWGVPSYLARESAKRAKARAVSFRQPRLPQVLAIDECSHARHRRYGTVFSDPTSGVVLDVGPGRSAAVIWAFASRYTRAERLAVEVVTIDCNSAWKTILHVAFPNALIVADHFHLQRRVLRALVRVRNDAAERKPEWRKVFTDARYARAKRPERLTDAQELQVYDATMLDERLAGAHELTDWFRAVMDPDLDLDEMAVLLDAWIEEAKAYGDPFAGTARSFELWRDEILAYARTNNATNAFAEGITDAIKVRKRIAYGYPSWWSLRATIIWTLGEALDPDTGELLPIRSTPPGHGIHLIQPCFA